MKGHPIRYSAAELRFIKARATWPRRDLLAAFSEKFGRSDVRLATLNALCKRKGWMTGRTGQYPKGHAPANKGKPHPAARTGNCAKHHFKKGHGRSGIAVDLWKPIGTERFNKDGYLERKVHDDLPRPGASRAEAARVIARRWRMVHLLNWEAVHGPVPKGMALKALDGNRLNTDPSNWTPVPRALLPRLGGRYGRDYDHAPADLKPTILAVVKLEHAAREKRRRAS